MGCSIQISYRQTLIISMSETHILQWGCNSGGLLSSSGGKSISTPAPATIPFVVKQISASQKHISFINKEGEVWSYGSNLDGRLGNGSKQDTKLNSSQAVKVKLQGRAIKIKCGFSHVIVAMENGQHFAWGLGEYGALGIGQFRSKPVPTAVILPMPILDFSCGAMHTAFIASDNSVYTCGSNEYGQLGFNRPQKLHTPTQITFNHGVKAVECGVFFTLLLSTRGQVYGMGNNKYGQLGIGHKVNEFHPTLIRQCENIVAIASGYHSAALDQKGALYLWGSGSFGEMLRPRKFIIDRPIRQICVRGFFGIAIAEGKVYVWGNNSHGELGRNNFEDAKQPIEVQALQGKEIGPIAVGVNFIIAVCNSTSSSKYISSPIVQPPSVSLQSAAKYQTIAAHYIPPPLPYANRPLHHDYTGLSNQRFSYSGYQSRMGRSLSPIQGIGSRYRKQEITNSNKRQAQKEIEQQDSRKINQSNHYSKEKHPVSFSPSLSLKPVQRNYEQQFLNLSSDYQILLSKYNALESQLSLLRKQTPHISPRKDTQKEELAEQNRLLREQIDILVKEVDNSREEKRQLKKQVAELQVQIERKSDEVIAIKKNSHFGGELSDQFNKLLNQKQKYIAQLSANHNRIQTELYQSIRILEEQKKRITDINQRNLNERKHLQQLLKLSQDSIFNLQQQYHVNMDKNSKLTIKLQKDIQQLQEQRLVEFKSKMDRQTVEMIKQAETGKGIIRQLQEQKKELFKIIENMKRNQEQDIKIYRQKCADADLKAIHLNQRIQELEHEVIYEKEHNKKVQAHLKELADQKDKAFTNLDHHLQLLQKERQKTGAMIAQVQKVKLLKKQVECLNAQIDKEYQRYKDYQKQMQQIVTGKQGIIRQLRVQIEKKMQQVERCEQARQKQVNELKQIINSLEKEQARRKREIADLNKDVEHKQTELENFKVLIDNLQRKLAFKAEQMEKQMKEHQKTTEQFTALRRQYAKLKSQKDQSDHKFQLAEKDKGILEGVIQQKKNQIEKLEKEIKRLEGSIENLKKEGESLRKELQQSNWALQESNRINQELSKANKQFADSQQHFTSKISQLQAKIYELQDENKSYTPRYEALLQRNKELDQRNNELSEMVNKAIQMQAEIYRSNILKEVQINTGQILEQVREEGQWRERNKRKEKQQKRNEEPSEQLQVPDIVSKVREEPYTKLMNQKINFHKKKVSQSAQKLAGILSMNGGGDTSERQAFTGQQSPQFTHKSFSKSMKIRNARDDYEQINSQMQSLNAQKQEFMSKISSFAQKLKIL